MGTTRSILLVGIQHSGKSSAGRHLARRLGRRFVDLDDELLCRAGKGAAGSTRELFAALGREEFRRREAETLSALLNTAEEPLVVAAGGGLADAPAAWEEIRRRALVVWIDVDDLVAWERVVRKGLPAYLQAKTPEEAMREFQAVNTRRRAVYRTVSRLQLRAETTSAATAARIQSMLPADC